VKKSEINVPFFQWKDTDESSESFCVSSGKICSVCVSLNNCEVIASERKIVPVWLVTPGNLKYSAEGFSWTCACGKVAYFMRDTILMSLVDTLQR